MSFIEWVNKNQGFATSLLTLIYIAATIAILIVMTRANALSQRNLKLLQDIETSRLRPYVTFDIVIERNIVTCVLKNSGISAARDVRVQVEPKVTGEIRKRQEEVALTRSVIGSLAPGREMREVIDAGPDFFAQYGNTPPTFRGELRYRDASGAEYVDSVVVDLSVYEHLLWTDLPDYRIEAPKLEKALLEVLRTALRPRQ